MSVRGFGGRALMLPRMATWRYGGGHEQMDVAERGILA
jgi:hypothetical protein